MGTTKRNQDEAPEQVTLQVDDRGRVTIPKAVRERLGIEPDSEIPAQINGTTLTVDPQPSRRLEPAQGDRETWENTTPTDAGESLFGGTTDDRSEG